MDLIIPGYFTLIIVCIMMGLISGKTKKPITPLALMMFVAGPLIIIGIKYPLFMGYTVVGLVISFIGGLVLRYSPHISDK
jgi:hypothetical protein